MCPTTRKLRLLRLSVLALAMFFILGIASAPARADSIMDVQLGSLIPANTPCCEEILADIEFNSTTDEVLSATSSGSGALGNFWFAGESSTTSLPIPYPGYVGYFFSFNDSANDMFTYVPEKILGQPFPSSSPFASPGSYPIMLDVVCANSTDTCASDAFGGTYDVAGTMRVTAVPEGSWSLEFLSAMLALCIFLYVAWRVQQWPFRITPDNASWLSRHHQHCVGEPRAQGSDGSNSGA